MAGPQDLKTARHLEARSLLDIGRVRSPVEPISRVWFELSDTNAFDACVSEVLRWMSQSPKRGLPPRSGIPLTPSALAGLSFDISDEFGANPTRAVRLDAFDGMLWAARLDWPDPSAPRSWVSEFFVEKRTGHLARFGAQLTCVRRGECAPTETTRPSVVQWIIDKLSAEADGRSLSELATPIGRSDVSDLTELLYSSDR